ncbi:hypothetical protein RRG08_017593, partial [Elysia crispata]
PRTRSGATARRQEAVKARRAAEARRLAELRQRERRKQYENRRFGFPRGDISDPPDLPNSFQQLNPSDFILIQDTPVDVSLADVEDILRQVDETPLDTRREFLPPAVSSFLDNHVARAMRERGFMTDTRRRQYDVAMYGINNRLLNLEQILRDTNLLVWLSALLTLEQVKIKRNDLLISELESPQRPPIHLSIERVSPQFPPAGYLSTERVSPQFPPAGYLSIELVSPQFPPAGYLSIELVSPQFPPAGYLSIELVSPQFPPVGYLSIELVSPQFPPAGYLSIELVSPQFPPAGYLSIELVSPQFPPVGYLSIELVSPQFPPVGYLSIELVSP